MLPEEADLGVLAKPIGKGMLVEPRVNGLWVPSDIQASHMARAGMGKMNSWFGIWAKEMKGILEFQVNQGGEKTP